MIPGMKAAPIFLRFCLLFIVCLFAVPVFSQSDENDSESNTAQEPSIAHCHPQAPRPFGIISVGIGSAGSAVGSGESASGAIERGPRPVTDEQLYSRYFRYAAEWDSCLSSGISPDSLSDEFPDPFPEGMQEDQRNIVMLVDADWVQCWRESMAASGPPSAAAIGPVHSWAQLQEQKQRRQHSADLTDERAKVMESRLQSLRLALGKTSFRGFDDYVHGLYQAIPGRLVRQPLSEGAVFARYLGSIATMNKFADKSGEDAQAAAKARADERDACGLSNKDESTLQKEADSFERDIHAHQAERRTSNSPEASSARGVPPREREEIGNSHLEHLQSSLSKAGFQKVEKRAQDLYQSDGPRRVIPASDPDPNAPDPKSDGAEAQPPAPAQHP